MMFYMSCLHTCLLMLFMHVLFRHIWSWIAIYIHIKRRIDIYTYLHIHISTYIQYIYIYIYVYIVFLRPLMLARVFPDLARVISESSQVDVDSFFPRSYDLTSPAQESPEGDFNGEGTEGCGGEQQPQPQQPKCPCSSFNGNQKKGGWSLSPWGIIVWDFMGQYFIQENCSVDGLFEFRTLYDDWESRANKAKHPHMLYTFFANKNQLISYARARDSIFWQTGSFESIWFGMPIWGSC